MSPSLSDAALFLALGVSLVVSLARTTANARRLWKGWNRIPLEFFSGPVLGYMMALIIVYVGFLCAWRRGYLP